MTHKMIIYWLIGSILLTISIWILGNVSLLAEDSISDDYLCINSALLVRNFFTYTDRTR